MTRAPDSHRHTAAVCRTEADTRRLTDPAFAVMLDQWASNADRRAVEAEGKVHPDLFGGRA